MSYFGQPVVSREANGCLTVFASYDSVVSGISQLSPNGYDSWDQNWYPIGTLEAQTNIELATYRDGTLGLFTVNNNQLYSIQETGPETWPSSWNNLGGDYFGSMTMGQNDRAGADEYAEVFMTTGSGIQHNYQLQSSTWIPLGILSSNVSGQMAVIQNQNGFLQLFSTDSGGQGSIWSAWQDWTTGSGGWSYPWYEVGNPSSNNGNAPYAILDSSDLVNLFTLGPNADVLFIVQNSQNGFSDWNSLGFQSMGGTTAQSQGCIAAGLDGQGNMLVFMVDNNGSAHVSPVVVGGSWTSLGYVGNSSPAVGKNADGTLEVFFFDGNFVSYTWEVNGVWQPISTLPAVPSQVAAGSGQASLR